VRVCIYMCHHVAVCSGWWLRDAACSVHPERELGGSHLGERAHGGNQRIASSNRDGLQLVGIEIRKRGFLALFTQAQTHN
jgi:hypothetical protein